MAIQILNGNIVHTPTAGASVVDYGDAQIMPSFADMHMHAPQYPSWAWICLYWTGLTPILSMPNRRSGTKILPAKTIVL